MVEGATGEKLHSTFIITSGWHLYNHNGQGPEPHNHKELALIPNGYVAFI